ncbi:unnamed protein product [Cylicostephanus goldi]|uniref:Uncharacterized protein n=1 Tax=Cylicostephanus goldi TaxID=71465 RepID=A0A3P7MWM6_CYLGO|nr:unnamed protein product [Cylicostephanus goldi]
MFANGPDQQFYQTPAPSQQQQQPGQSQQQHPSVIVRQPELPDDPDETGYATSSSCYGFTSPVVPTYSTYPIPLLFPDWNQFGMGFCRLNHFEFL